MITTTHAHTFEVFTTHSRAVLLNGEKALVCELDKLQQIEAQMASQLHDSMSPWQVKSVVKGYEQQIEHAAYCQQRAMDLDITELPAIVIDGRFAVYGMDSIHLALNAYEKEIAGAQ